MGLRRSGGVLPAGDHVKVGRVGEVTLDCAEIHSTDEGFFILLWELLRELQFQGDLPNEALLPVPFSAQDYGGVVRGMSLWCMKSTAKMPAQVPMETTNMSKGEGAVPSPPPCSGWSVSMVKPL